MQTKISKSTAVICGCILLCIAAASLLQLWTASPKRALSDEQARKAGYSSSSERTQIFEWEQARYDNKLLSDRDVAEATSMLKGASISSHSEILSTLINLGLRDKPMKSETVSLISEYINDPEWSVRYTMAMALSPTRPNIFTQEMKQPSGTVTETLHIRIGAATTFFWTDTFDLPLQVQEERLTSRTEVNFLYRRCLPRVFQTFCLSVHNQNLLPHQTHSWQKI